MKNEKTFAEVLTSTLSLITNIYALAEYCDEYFYKSSHGEMDSTDLIENITFNLNAIEKYHFGEDAPKSTDYVRDDHTAAQAIIEAIMSLINFMVDYTSPHHIYALLNERAKDLAENLILCITRDGIDTTKDCEILAYAYQVLGERAAFYAVTEGGSTPTMYFDTDALYKAANEASPCHVVTMERGFGEKYANYQEAIRRIRGILLSDKSSIACIAEISNLLLKLDEANGIDTIKPQYAEKDGE